LCHRKKKYNEKFKAFKDNLGLMYFAQEGFFFFVVEYRLCKRLLEL
jgi:hypothetical protein